MSTGEAEFHAEGVGPLASAGEATGSLVRRLGAFERLYQRRGKRTRCTCAWWSSALTTSIRSPRAGSLGGDDDANARG
jgi:hypothetical protein